MVPTILVGKVSVPIASERYHIFQILSGEIIAGYSLLNSPMHKHAMFPPQSEPAAILLIKMSLTSGVGARLSFPLRDPLLLFLIFNFGDAPNKLPCRSFYNYFIAYFFFQKRLCHGRVH